jgi:hypothetical protein
MRRVVYAALAHPNVTKQGEVQRLIMAPDGNVKGAEYDIGGERTLKARLIVPSAGAVNRSRLPRSLSAALQQK